jgi:hypothetical protein
VLVFNVRPRTFHVTRPNVHSAIVATSGSSDTAAARLKSRRRNAGIITAIVSAVRPFLHDARLAFWPVQANGRVVLRLQYSLIGDEKYSPGTN